MRSLCYNPLSLIVLTQYLTIMRTDFHNFAIDEALVRLDFDKSLRLANLYRDSESFQEILLVVHGSDV